MNATIQSGDERPASVRPYLCWILVLALGFYDLVYLREVIVSVLVVLEIDLKLFLLFDKIGFFLFGVCGLLVILLTEPYLRNGWKRRCLTVRFLRLIAIGFGCLSLFWAILMALPGLAARPTVADLAGASILSLCAAGALSRTLTSADQPS